MQICQRPQMTRADGLSVVWLLQTQVPHGGSTRGFLMKVSQEGSVPQEGSDADSAYTMVPDARRESSCGNRTLVRNRCEEPNLRVERPCGTSVGNPRAERGPQPVERSLRRMRKISSRIGVLLNRGVVSRGIGVPFETNFEHSSPPWALVRTWLENIQRFSTSARA